MRELSYSSLVKIKAILIIHVKYVVYNQDSRDSEDYKTCEYSDPHLTLPIPRHRGPVAVSLDYFS